MLVVYPSDLANPNFREIESFLASVANQIRKDGTFRPGILIFKGFDHDPRAICQIPEIRRWIDAVWKKYPCIPPLIEQSAGTSQMFLLGLLDSACFGDPKNGEITTAIPQKQIGRLIEEATKFCATFLRSCGYKRTDQYLEEWQRSMTQGLVSKGRVKIFLICASIILGLGAMVGWRKFWNR